MNLHRHSSQEKLAADLPSALYVTVLCYAISYFNYVTRQGNNTGFKICQSIVVAAYKVIAGQIQTGNVSFSAFDS